MPLRRGLRIASSSASRLLHERVTAVKREEAIAMLPWMWGKP